MRKNNHLIFLFLALILIVFWSKILFTDKIPFYRDIILQFYPWQNFANENIRNGNVPLWNPYITSGAPFLANLQSAVFYPLKIFFYVLPYTFALKLFIFVNIFLGGIFMFYLAKDFKLSNYASYLSGVVFMLNGYLITRVEFFSVLGASVWLPLIFLFVKKYLEKFKLKFVLLSGVFMSMTIFAGNLQVFFYNLLFLFFYTIWFSVSAKKNIFKNISMLTVACLVSVLISMVQLLPFVEYVLNSGRGEGLSFAVASHWSLHPKHLINFVLPYFFGNPAVSSYSSGSQFWVISFYIGIVPLLLVTVFSWIRRGKTTSFLFLLFLFFLVLSFGSHTPLFYLLYNYVLPFKLIRYPATAMYIVVFILVLLTAFSFNDIEKIVNKRKNVILINITLVLTITLFVFYLIAHSFTFNIEKVRLQIIQDSILLSLIFVGLFYVLLFFVINRKISPNVFKVSLISLASLDLIIFGVGLNPVVSEKYFFHTPEIAKFLNSDKDPFYRVFLTPRTTQLVNNVYFTEIIKENGVPYKESLADIKDLLYDNYNMIHDVHSADGYDPLMVKEQDRLTYLLKFQSSPKETRILDLLNVRYVLGFTELNEPSLEFIKNINNVLIYKNKNFLKRVFVVDKVIVVKSGKEAINLIKENKFNPDEEVILTEEVILANDAVKNTGKAEITDYGNEQVLIKVNAVSESMLVFLDTYFPGWKVYIDDKEDKIFKANYAFRAVHLKKGEHLVRFSYEPVSFKIGLLISLLTGTLIFVWIFKQNIWYI